MEGAIKRLEDASLYPAAAERVIEAVLEGKRLRDSIMEAGLTPVKFQKLLAERKDLASAYARAQEIHADLLADEIVHIADSSIDHQKARNQIDARKWVASKKAPKTYGERIDLNVTQTIDILGTIQTARARLLRPICDSAPDVEDVTPIESSTCEDIETDKQSVPDIFS